MLLTAVYLNVGSFCSRWGYSLYWFLMCLLCIFAALQQVRKLCHDFETTVTCWRVNCVIIQEIMTNNSYSATEPFVGGTPYYKSSKWVLLLSDNMISLLYQECRWCSASNTCGQNCLVINLYMFVMDVGWPGNQVSFPFEARNSLSFSRDLNQLWRIFSLLSSGYWFSPGGKWQGHEADHSRLSGAEVRNAWSCTSTALSSWCAARITEDYLIQTVKMAFGGFVTQTTSVYCVVAAVLCGTWEWFYLACKALADMFHFVSKWNWTLEHTMVAVCTTCFNIKKLHFYPTVCLYIYFIWFFTRN
jgi:hypothetical protein